VQAEGQRSVSAQLVYVYFIWCGFALFVGPRCPNGCAGKMQPAGREAAVLRGGCCLGAGSVLPGATAPGPQGTLLWRLRTGHPDQALTIYRCFKILSYSLSVCELLHLQG